MTVAYNEHPIILRIMSGGVYFDAANVAIIDCSEAALKEMQVFMNLCKGLKTGGHPRLMCMQFMDYSPYLLKVDEDDIEGLDLDEVYDKGWQQIHKPFDIDEDKCLRIDVSRMEVDDNSVCWEVYEKHVNEPIRTSILLREWVDKLLEEFK